MVVNNSCIIIIKYVDSFSLFGASQFKQGVNRLSILFGLVEGHLLIVGFIDFVAYDSQH